MSKQKKYYFNCECGHRITFESKQPKELKIPIEEFNQRFNSYETPPF